MKVVVKTNKKKVNEWTNLVNEIFTPNEKNKLQYIIKTLKIYRELEHYLITSATQLNKLLGDMDL